MNIREKIYRFMIGRNGPDELNRFILIFGLVLAILNIFFRYFAIYIAEYLVLIIFIFRFVSKNVYKRREENGKYLKIKNSAVSFLKLYKNKWKDRKTHVYKKCPHCKSVLRLPKVKGEHGVSCPCCKKHFDMKV